MKKGYLNVFLTTIFLRIVLIYYCINISGYSKLKSPNIIKNEKIINFVDKKYILKNKSLLIGNYTFPITTIFNFFENLELIKKKENIIFNIFIKLICFLSFDSERFLKYSLNNLIYITEESCAFFPLYPFILKLIIKLYMYIFYNLNYYGNNFENFGKKDIELILTVILGIIINNIISIINSLLLYKLIRLLLLNRIYISNNINLKINKLELLENKAKKIGYLSCFIYNIYPGFVFTTSLYTEPIYSFLTFLCLLLLFSLNFNYFGNLKNKSIFKKLNKYIKEIILVIIIIIKSFTRSNGLVFGLVLFLHFFFNYIYFMLNTYLEQGFRKKKYFTVKKIIKLWLITFFYWVKNSIWFILILSPFLIIQLYGFFVFCKRFILYSYNLNLFSFFKFFLELLKFNSNNLIYIILVKNKRYLRKFCLNKIPLIYSFVQNKYWGIKKFYSFSSLENLIHFFYTFPLILVYFIYFWNYFRFIKNNYNNYKKSRLSEKVKLIGNLEFYLVIYLIFLLPSFLLFSHIQILFRQSLALLPYFLEFSTSLYGDNYFSGEITENKNLENTNNKKSKFYFVLLVYNVILCFVGNILFCNHVGWT